MDQNNKHLFPDLCSKTACGITSTGVRRVPFDRKKLPKLWEKVEKNRPTSEKKKKKPHRRLVLPVDTICE